MARVGLPALPVARLRAGQWTSFRAAGNHRQEEARLWRSHRVVGAGGGILVNWHLPVGKWEGRALPVPSQVLQS